MTKNEFEEAGDHLGLRPALLHQKILTLTQMLNSKCYEPRPTPGQHPTKIKTKRLNIIISFIKCFRD